MNFDQPDDQRFELQRQNQETFIKAFYDNYKLLLHISRKMVFYLTDAEQIMSDVFLKLSTKLSAFDGPKTTSDIKSYLIRSTINACIDFRRAGRAGQEDSSGLDEALAEDTKIVEVQARLLDKLSLLIGELSDEEWQLLFKRFWEEKSKSQTAEELQLSYDACHKREQRLLLRLRDKFDPNVLIFLLSAFAILEEIRKN